MKLNVLDIMRDVQRAGKSMSEARRLSFERSILINGNPVSLTDEIEVVDGDVLKIGKLSWVAVTAVSESGKQSVRWHGGSDASSPSS